MDVSALLMSALGNADRLFSLDGSAPFSSMLVERWSAREQMSSYTVLVIDVLSVDADLDMDALVGQGIHLRARPSDGSPDDFRSGLVCAAQSMGSDGALARYRLVVVSWSWLLTQGRHSRVFQDQSVLDIVSAVFAAYAPYASWRVTADATALLAQVRPRSYCVQYRERDATFVDRLLTEEGLGYAFVEDTDAPSGQTMVIFADSSQLPEDPTSAAGSSGLRFQRSADTQGIDTLQAMAPARQLTPDRVTLLSTDYKTLSAVSTTLSLSDTVSQREHYEPVGAYAFADSREADHYAQLLVQAWEARRQGWDGQGSIPSARAGTHFRVSQTPWAASDGGTGAGQGTDFVWTSIHHAGVNNLPTSLLMQVQQSLGTAPPLPIGRTALDDHWYEAAPSISATDGLDDDSALWDAAQAHGYAMRFQAITREQPWRPTLADGTGLRLNPRPTAFGAQTALVVGPQGETSPGASGPLYQDSLGRVKIRFHWQTDGGSCWVRVSQPYAGAGHGMQAVPRIGQEVSVQFIDGDIDRPIILGAVYGGQGEAGVAPTTGGVIAAVAGDASALYAQAGDHSPSAQGNLAGGNSPAWHGMGAGDAAHRNAAALSGLKTQGWDGSGANQFVMDDTDSQGRVQLATTHAATELNLGHLVHQADNYRGSFRGEGYELRSDQYGAVRASRGLLVSSYSVSPGDPAGDATGALALLKQHIDLSKALSEAATTHTTIPLAAHEGVTQANASALNPQAAPLDALHQSLGATVDGSSYDGAQPTLAGSGGATQPGAVPHSADALLTLAGRAGIVGVAGQSLHWAAGETLSLGSGQDINLAVNNQLRLHSGQGIGWLAGAVSGPNSQPGTVGMSLIAGKGAVDVQAQHDTLALRSKGEMKLVSVNAQTEFAAAKTVHLAVSGGAHLIIEGGNITFGAPGNILIHASNKSFVGPTQLSHEMNSWPDASFDQKVKVLLRDGKTPASNYHYQLVRADGAKINGLTDGDGWAHLQQGMGPEEFDFILLGPA